MKRTEYPHLYIHDHFCREDFTLDQLQFESKYYQKGSLLPVHSEDMEYYCYYIRSGIIELNFTNSGSNTKIAAFFGPHSIAPVIFDSQFTLIDSECSLKAFTDLEVVTLYISDVKQYCMINSQFALHLLEESSSLIRSLLFQQMDLSYASSFTRVCDTLLMILNDFQPADHVVPLSQSELSDIAGCSKVQVERALQQLRKEEIILSGRNQITVTDIHRLINHCSDYLKAE